MTLKINRKITSERDCQCDCIKGTCSDCFIRGMIKPWCTNCHQDINDGKCCNNQKPHIKKGWIDVTPHIVKHTKEQKNVIYTKIKKHNDRLKDATNFYEKCWQGKECKKCGKKFLIQGKYGFETCRSCTRKIVNMKDIWKKK